MDQAGQGLEEDRCSSPSLFPGREGATCLCVFANRQELRPVIIISSLWCLLTVINTMVVHCRPLNFHKSIGTLDEFGEDAADPFIS